MSPDSELLATYARTNSEDAFAELVRRHVNLVYSAALRHMNGDEHMAKDVTQTVFTTLARKARPLAHHQCLTGWLYTSVHFTAAKIIRTETRRRDREDKFMREPASEPAPEVEWENLRPALDDAMHELKEADREAILLRYFENRPFAEVGARTGLSENTARMRVERAVEKLRAAFARRGIATGSALTTVISAHAVQMAPANLAATMTSVAITGTGTFTLLKIMTATQIKLGLGALVVAGAATALVVQNQAQDKLRAANGALTQQLSQLQADTMDLSNRLAATADSPKLAATQQDELLKLRGEVSLLRQQAGQLAKLRSENERLLAAQHDREAQPAAADAIQQVRQAGILKLTHAKDGLLAFIMFAGENQDQYPTNFSQTSKFLNADLMGQLETNFDLVYQGLSTGITNPAGTIVLREKQPWQSPDGKWLKTYGFADGHAELHTEPDGNFDDYESQHIILPTPGQ